MGNSIYVNASAPNNQSGCQQGGIGLVVIDENNEVVYEDSITIHGKIDCSELKLLAFIEGLEYAEDGDAIFSDSEYCEKGFNEWLDNWKRKGWRKSDKKPVANRALWQQVDRLRSDKYVEVFKVKAHFGNERADALAMEAALD
ncbi:ribonuclease H [Vibrio sp. MACH09]|uniref:RNase H family protein n=1 Tax=Vibrio sp. MACH09 TaxID=3025122 RepID=UPI00278D1370|nr:RNase H family protein [Vibrio sp. MACH09]GLO60100.1 ribonuclease H [Vibrio sp. MACH09]